MLNLFDLTSTSFTSNAFLLDRQVTVAAIGLPAGGEIQFETVYFRDTPDGNVNIDCGACADACGPGSFPTSSMVVIGTKRLSCGPCETADPCECPADEALRIAKYNVKLTSTSSYIVLDAPIGSYIRAVYIGTGLGTFHVFYSNSDTRDLTDTMRGCCPVENSPCNNKDSIMAAAPLQVNLSDTLTAIPSPTACQSNFGTTVTGKLVQFVPGYGWFAPDGSETKVVAGTNIASITGAGTTASPYIINAAAQPGGAAADGSETIVTAGTGIAVTGTGTVAAPYVVATGVAPFALALTQNNPTLIPVPTAGQSHYGLTPLQERVVFIPGIGWEVIGHRFSVMSSPADVLTVTDVSATVRETVTAHRAGIVSVTYYAQTLSSTTAGSNLVVQIFKNGVVVAGDGGIYSDAVNNGIFVSAAGVTAVAVGDVITFIASWSNTSAAIPGIRNQRTSVAYID